MPVSLTANCPTCNASVSDEERACTQCGAALSAFPSVERTPLILPGNPALSADLVREKVRPIHIVAASVTAAIALLSLLWFRSTDDAEPVTPPLARGITLDSTDEASAATAPQAVSTARDSSNFVVISSTSATAAALPPIPDSTEAAAIPVPVSAAAATVTPPVTADPAPRVIAARARVAAPLAPTVIPVLRLASLVSDSLRPGERLQLRWTVQDRATGRAVPGTLEFTSADPAVADVDRRTGVVSARSPGRVKIIADGGAAGQSAIDLWVRAPVRPANAVSASTAQPGAVASTTTSESLQIGSDAARSVSATPAPNVRAPVIDAPPAAPARQASRADLLDADDVRGAVDRFVGQVRAGTVKNFELQSFFQDGAGHRATLVAAPTTSGATANVVRVAFELRLTKFDAAGRPLTRLAPVSMEIEKRLNEVSASAIAVSPLRKP